MMMTKASKRPNTAATTPSIGADTSAWKPSRVAGTARLISQTASTVTASVKQTAPSMITAIGTVFRTPRSTGTRDFNGRRLHVAQRHPSDRGSSRESRAPHVEDLDLTSRRLRLHRHSCAGQNGADRRVQTLLGEAL